MKKNLIKAVVLGESGVGKEHFILAMQGKAFQEKQQTIGAEFFVMETEEAKIQIWGVAGAERFRSIIPMYLRESKIVFLVYDINSKKSFEKLKELLQDVNNHVEGFKLFIIGNKLDLAATQREVPVDEAAAFAQEHDAVHLEVSAKEQTNIDQSVVAFLQAVKQHFSPQEEAVGKESTTSSINSNIKELRDYAAILNKLKDKELFSSGPEKKSQAITDLLAQPLTKDSLALILKNEHDPLVKNRNILGNGFFRIKSKILGHTNPLRDGRACVSDTEWKLVQIYNALPGSGQDDGLELSEDSQSSSTP